MIIQPTKGPASTQYEAYQEVGERNKDGKTREPIELVSGATSSDKEQLRGPGTMPAKEIPKETKRNRQMGWEATAAAGASKHNMEAPPKKKKKKEL